MKKFTIKLIILLLTFYILHSTFYIPVYAAPSINPTPCPSASGGGIELGGCYGFGGIPSLGEGTSRLVKPAFSLATVIVVIYFLLGAFKYMTAQANKEEISGAQQMITQAIVGFIILIFIFFALPFMMFSLFGIVGFRLF